MPYYSPVQIYEMKSIFLNIYIYIFWWPLRIFQDPFCNVYPFLFKLSRF